MGLSGQIVDLVRLDFLHDVDQGGGVGHVAVVQDETARGEVRVLVDTVDSGGIEERSPALDAMDLVSLGQQEFGEIRTVLPRDSRNQRLLQCSISLSIPQSVYAPARTAIQAM